MSNMDLNSAQSSNFDSQTLYAVTPKDLDGIKDAEETEWYNKDWREQYGIFYSHPDTQSAILMKVVWNVGKGYICDADTQTTLDFIEGNGKQTFEDIIFNVEVCKEIGGDGYAEIVRDKETGQLVNLKVLDPGRIKIIYNGAGRIIRYEQTSPFPQKGIINKIKSAIGLSKVEEFEPEQIYHRTRNRIGDQTHGLSTVDLLKETVLKDLESFEDMSKVMHRQAKPMIMFKLGTDNVQDISAFIAKMDEATQKGENIYIPNDNNTVDYEVVQVNVSEMLLAWRSEIRNRIYRVLGLPLIIFGASGSTESGGKMEYLAHQQVFEREQREIERQIWSQLQIKIDLIPPTSLLEDLQRDTSKDGAAQQLNVQPSEATPGKGR